MPRWRSMPLLRPFSWKNVSYSSQDHRKKTLDIAIPEKPFPRKRLPTCIFVHGGSWQRGDKASPLNEGVAQAFADAGYCGVAINYRLSPEVMHPDHANDVAESIAWLHQNITHYGGDPEQLFLVGHSAGAHLMMHLLANPTYLQKMSMQDDLSKFIQGIVGISGVYNVVRLANTAFYGSLTVSPAFGDRTDRWREASITTAIAKQGSACPLAQTPMLLLTAESDFHFEQDAKELEEWVEKAGNTKVYRESIQDTNHFSIVANLATGMDGDVMKRVLDFIQHIQQV